MLLISVINSNAQSVYDFHLEGLRFAKKEISKNTNLKPSIIVNEFIETTDDYSSLSDEEKKELDGYILNKNSILEVANSKINELKKIEEVSSKLIKDLDNFYSFIEHLEFNSNNKEVIKQKVKDNANDRISQAYLFTLSSYDFWEEEEDGNVTAIRLDAGGYIIGWVDALIDDYNNGEDTSGDWGSSRSWHRIRKGATFGLGCSIGKWW